MSKKGITSGPAHLRSATLSGIEAIPVDIEVDVLAGLPSFTVVGLGDTAIKESKERITSALSNAGFDPPRRKTIVSLAPASLRKSGSLYDVAIALGFLIASKQFEISSKTLEILQNSWFIGELGLDGTIRPVNGVLPIALTAKDAEIKNLFVPTGNANEVSALAGEINIFTPTSIQELLDHLAEQTDSNKELAKLSTIQEKTVLPPPEVDFSDIKGQEHAKRALLIAAASSHNVLLIGPPGTGKTLLARALAGILPPLNKEESFTVTSLYSIAGELKKEQGLIQRRPYRSPHHGASSVALVGGGANPKPGEVSLAHTGVLFLDELPEFSRHVLDQLRQPIEDGVITVSRASQSVQFPARSQLVAAMNPCPCGFVGSDRKECQCSAGEVVKYQRKVSGPLLDRFDIHVLVADIPIEELLEGDEFSPTSTDLAHQALDARKRAYQRQDKVNSELNVSDVKQICSGDKDVAKLLYQAEQRFHLSSRAVHRILKVSRTIADLEGSENIEKNHLAEALQYREQIQATLPDFV